MALDAPAERPYGHAELGSHYQGQVAATESRYGGAAEASAWRIIGGEPERPTGDAMSTEAKITPAANGSS